MIQSVLGFFILAGWLLFSFSIVFVFIRNLRRFGLRGALRRLLSVKLLVPLVLMIGLTVVKLSLVFIYPGYIGVVVSVLQQQGIRPNPIRPGLHWVVPLAEHSVIYPAFWQTYTMSYRTHEGDKADADAIVARTLDSQEVTIDISIIFRIDPEQVVELHKFWQQRYKEEMLRPGVRGLLRREVSQFTVDEVNSNKRNELADKLDADLKEIAAQNYLIVKRVLLRNIGFSKDYAQSVERKQVALQGETQKIYEAKQIENLAQGKANKIRIVADAEADAIRIRAEAKAHARLIRAEAEAEALRLVDAALKDKRNLLVYRYIDRLSPNIKAVVLPHDMPLIFPLPDMQPPQPPAEASLEPNEKNADQGSLMPQPIAIN